MLNKKMIIFFLSFFLFVVSCNKKENESKKKNSENLQNKTTQENIFSNNSIEKIIETFSKKSKEIIENMVVNLIQVSDENIKDSEARVIYAKILSNLGEKELSGLLTYTNKITYGVRIDPLTSEFIFFAKESENESNVTSIQQFKVSKDKKENLEILANLKKNKK